MPTVEFQNVGRGKSSWKEDMPVVDYYSIIKAVKRKKVLASKEIDVEMSEAGGGIYVDGFRCVGKFTITKATGK